MPVGTRIMFSFVPAALIVMLPVGATIVAVFTLPSNASPDTFALDALTKPLAITLPLAVM